MKLTIPYITFKEQINQLVEHGESLSKIKIRTTEDLDVSKKRIEVSDFEIYYQCLWGKQQQFN